MTPAQPLIPFFTQRPTGSGAAAEVSAKKGSPREAVSDELVTAIWPASGPLAPIKHAARGSSPDLRRKK